MNGGEPAAGDEGAGEDENGRGAIEGPGDDARAFYDDLLARFE